MLQLGSSPLAHVPQLPTGQGSRGVLFPSSLAISRGCGGLCSSPSRLGLWSCSCSPSASFFAVAFGHPFVLIFLFLLHDGVCGLMRGHMTWTLEFGRENGLMSSSDAEKYK